MASTSNPFDVLEEKLDAIMILFATENKHNERRGATESRENDFINKERVSEILKVSHVTIGEWEKRGILQSYRIGNLKRFKLSEVLAEPIPIIGAKKR